MEHAQTGTAVAPPHGGWQPYVSMGADLFLAFIAAFALGYTIKQFGLSGQQAKAAAKQAEAADENAKAARDQSRAAIEQAKNA